jgi:hypothetical protein
MGPHHRDGLLSAFVKRGTDAGIRITIWDDRFPYVLIPVLAIAAVSSTVSGKPFSANWYSTKVPIYSGLLVIGLILRFVMRHWTEIFRQLAVGGPNAALEAKLAREINLSRKLAYVYWIGIGTVAFIGVTKFFCGWSIAAVSSLSARRGAALWRRPPQAVTGLERTILRSRIASAAG